MADRDPRDLILRSQALFQGFYRFHKQSCDAWYIKNTKHQFVDASYAFISRFVSVDGALIVKILDEHTIIAPKEDILLMHEYEQYVLDTGNELRLIAVNHFYDRDGMHCLLVSLNRLKINNELLLVGYIQNLDTKRKSLIEYFIPLEPAEETKPDVAISRFLGANPTDKLTEVEWITVWMRIAGMNFVNIAHYMGVSPKAIEHRMERIYFKLQVLNVGELLFVADALGWVNYIPDSFMQKRTLLKAS